MGLPSIDITFKTTAASAITRGERGIVALILKDAVENGFKEIQLVSEIPVTLSTVNKKFISLALIGGIKPPKKVVMYILPLAAANYSAAQTYLETVKWDYLAVPEIADGDRANMVTWIKGLRDTLEKKVKLVIDGVAGDHEGIITFTTVTLSVGETVNTTKDYAPRIAGLLAGTPLTVSATFQILPEITDVSPRLTKSQLNTAIDAGKFEIYNDGEKCKVARAVNSLVTTTADKGATFKKIKVVDILDLIYTDIKRTAEDNYIGKYANSYDNKVLLITAINGYFAQLITDGLLDSKAVNQCTIDLVAQRNYLVSIGTNVENLTEQQIKEYNTNDKVFLAATIKPLDAIEDISIGIKI